MTGIIVIGFASLLFSLLTFFTGFGLGTLLMPVFAIFFPVEVAVALTAIVHLANNIFKLFLTGKKADRAVVLRFGLPAIIGALIGAFLLLRITGHQGALRSAFLVRAGLSKESFIATGVIIACMIDITRLGVYFAVMLILLAIALGTGLV